MNQRDAPHDREAKAEAARVPVTAGIEPVKRFEYATAFGKRVERLSLNGRSVPATPVGDSGGS